MFFPIDFKYFLFIYNNLPYFQLVNTFNLKFIKHLQMYLFLFVMYFIYLTCVTCFKTIFLLFIILLCLI